MNYIKRLLNLSRPIGNEVKLGRWNLKNCQINETVSVFWTNSDHCGDILCGDVRRNKEILDKKLNKLKSDENVTINTMTSSPH